MKKPLVFIAVLISLLLIASVGLVAIISVNASSAKAMAVARLKKDVARDLHDPSSVRFRDLNLLSYSDHLESFSLFIAFIQEDKALALKLLRGNPQDLLTYREDAFRLCGQLNAKNRMGAYVGYTDFYVTGSDPAKPFVVIEGLGWDKKFIADMCKIGTVVLKPTDEQATSP